MYQIVSNVLFCVRYVYDFLFCILTYIRCILKFPECKSIHIRERQGLEPSSQQAVDSRILSFKVLKLVQNLPDYHNFLPNWFPTTGKRGLPFHGSSMSSPTIGKEVPYQGIYEPQRLSAPSCWNQIIFVVWKIITLILYQILKNLNSERQLSYL